MLGREPGRQRCQPGGGYGEQLLRQRPSLHEGPSRVPQTSPRQVATSGKPRSRICGLALSSRASLAPSYDSPSDASTFAATLHRGDDAGHTNSWQNRRHLSPAVICMRDHQPVPMCPPPSTAVALPQRQAVGTKACLQGIRSKWVAENALRRSWSEVHVQGAGGLGVSPGRTAGLQPARDAAGLSIDRGLQRLVTGGVLASARVWHPGGSTHHHCSLASVVSPGASSHSLGPPGARGIQSARPSNAGDSSRK
jgi:hypothetical protein